MKRRAITVSGVSAVAVAAVLIVVAAFTDAWLRAEFTGNAISVGLRAVSVCRDGECERLALAECESYAAAASAADDTLAFFRALTGAPGPCRVLLEAAVTAAIDRQVALEDRAWDPHERPPPIEPGVFLAFARITFYLSLAAGLLLVVCAGLGAAGVIVIRPIAPSTLALVALFALLVTSPTSMAVHPFRGMGVNWAFVVHGAGITLGLLGAIVLGRIRPPGDDEVMDDEAWDRWQEDLPPMVDDMG